LRTATSTARMAESRRSPRTTFPGTRLSVSASCHFSRLGRGVGCQRRLPATWPHSFWLPLGSEGRYTAWNLPSSTWRGAVMSDRHDRREVLKRAGGALLGGLLGTHLPARAGEAAVAVKGYVTGQPEAVQVGTEVLAAGGNAVDAIVAAALTAGVVAVPSCGIGGYGGPLVIAAADGKKGTALDFNSAPPAPAPEDLSPLNEKGQVKDNVHLTGWLAPGVPGTLAGLQLALDRYGTQPFAKLVQPAIKYARDGFEVRTNFANATRANRASLLKDPGS